MFCYIFSIILESRSLKFPELENWELEVPGTWELRNLGTSELGNLFKGIPSVHVLYTPYRAHGLMFCELFCNIYFKDILAQKNE